MLSAGEPASVSCAAPRTSRPRSGRGGRGRARGFAWICPFLEHISEKRGRDVSRAEPCQSAPLTPGSQPVCMEAKEKERSEVATSPLPPSLPPSGARCLSDGNA
ncbi:hypothetical protein MHYP_G00290640 [Metynnis hypsauchen]